MQCFYFIFILQNDKMLIGGVGGVRFLKWEIIKNHVLSFDGNLVGV